VAQEGIEIRGSVTLWNDPDDPHAYIYRASVKRVGGNARTAQVSLAHADAVTAEAAEH
jgi:hypothetical protein